MAEILTMTFYTNMLSLSCCCLHWALAAVVVSYFPLDKITRICIIIIINVLLSSQFEITTMNWQCEKCESENEEKDSRILQLLFLYCAIIWFTVDCWRVSCICDYIQHSSCPSVSEKKFHFTSVVYKNTGIERL